MENDTVLQKYLSPDELISFFYAFFFARIFDTVAERNREGFKKINNYVRKIKLLFKNISARRDFSIAFLFDCIIGFEAEKIVTLKKLNDYGSKMELFVSIVGPDVSVCRVLTGM